MIHNENIINKYIDFIPEVNQNDLKHYYQKVDACIFPSQCETFGIGVLESMASSLPILCSKNNPLKDILEKDAIYFDSSNPNDISKKILLIKENKELYLELSSIMYKKSLNFKWEKVTLETFDFLNRIYKIN